MAVASQCPVGYDGLRFTATAQPKEGERRVSVAATHPHLYHYTDAHAFRSDWSFCFVERSPTARNERGLAARGERGDVPAIVEQFQTADLAPFPGNQLVAPDFTKRKRRSPRLPCKTGSA